MEIDLSPLWSWVLPLWGLFVLALMFVGSLLAPTVIPAIHVGGARALKRVRFTLP